MKFSYYVKQAVKKPYLIKTAFYKKHLGIIISFDLKDVDDRPMRDSRDSFVIRRCLDAGEITEYYHQIGRDSLTYDKVCQWLEKGNDCWVIYNHNVIIGATWVLFGEFEIPQLSGRCLSENKRIVFDPNAGYVCYSFVNKEYRGQGLNQQLIRTIKYHYKHSATVEQLIAITGANNAAYIRSANKNNGFVIGIVEVVNICGFLIRKEYFIDKKEKSWL